MPLTVEQRRVVEYPRLDQNMLVNACAGAGKSQCMISRIRHMIEFLGVTPNQIMAITYTRTAGTNMEMRIKRELARYKAELPMVEYCDTFHAIARAVLRKIGLLNTTNDLCDVDEVLLQFLEFLRSGTPAAQAFKRGIKYLFIDEFQDSNELMCRIAQELAPTCSIFAVGDDLQNIMSFQGSSVRFIRDFAQLFAPCVSFNLSVNFRCSDAIIKLANAIVGNGRVHEYIQKPEPISVEEYLHWQQQKAEGAPLPPHVQSIFDDSPLDVADVAGQAAIVADVTASPTAPCSICTEELNKSEQRFLDCKHVFHKSCVDIWIERDRTQQPDGLATCPLCRARIEPKPFVSRAPKPRLEHCQDAFRALESTCAEIIAVLRPPLGEIKPHHICILSRSAYFLHQAHAILLAAGIKCIFLRNANNASKRLGKDGAQQPQAASVEELCKDRVILSTMHGAKGMEFDRGYILTLSKKHMPDIREPDVDAERRLLNVAVTRFRSHVVVWNVFTQASLFVRELYNKFPGEQLKELVETRVPNLLPLESEEMLEQLAETKRSERARQDQAFDERTPMTDFNAQYLKVDEWVSSLNGTSYRKLRQSILPRPLKFKISSIPSEYRIPPPIVLAPAPAVTPLAAPIPSVPTPIARHLQDEAIEQAIAAAAEADGDAEQEHALFGPKALALAEAEEDEEDDDNAHMYDDQQESEDDNDWEEEVLPSHRQIWPIVVNSLEESVRHFLDAAMLRFVQEMKRTQDLAAASNVALRDTGLNVIDTTKATSVQKYCFPPTRDCLLQMHRRGQNIDQKHKRRVMFDYDTYQDVNKPWNENLAAIYWTAASMNLRAGKCAMMHTPIGNKSLEAYLPLMDEMQRVLHYLVYSPTMAPHCAAPVGTVIDKPRPGAVPWECWTFYHLPTTGRSAGSNTQCYMTVGERLILWCNDSDDHGSFPVELVIKALCYASLLVLERRGRDADPIAEPPIRRIQIYHTFSRKLCDIQLGDWEGHQEMIDFFAGNKRSVYHFDF